jgi:ribose 5-phosphate isomerase B
MKVFVGSDHAGFEVKSSIINSIQSNFIVDCGSYSADPSSYPIFAKIVSQNTLENPDAFGILICGTGIGVSIAANRYLGIRAALCVNANMARLAREHNNANVLCLGARVNSLSDILGIVHIFLNTKFTDHRHLERIKMLDVL